MTAPDAEPVRIFRDFLIETPAAVANGKERFVDLIGVAGGFRDRATYEAWRMKWLPYVCGLAAGPSIPEEWPAYRDQIKEMRR